MTIRRLFLLLLGMVGAASIGAADRVTDGLIALYHFEEGGGAVIRDVSEVGEALDLTVINPGALTWLPGGGCLIHTPTRMQSDGPAMKIVQACTNSEEVTMEAWIKPANLSLTGPARIVTLSADMSHRNFTLGQFEDMCVARLRTTTTGLNGTDPEAFSDPGAMSTNLMHVVGTRNAAGTANLYIDGVEVSSGILGGYLSNWDATYRFAIGRELSGAFPWLGEIHLVAVYGRALSESEIQQNFADGVPGDHDRAPFVVTQPRDVVVTEPALARFSVSAGGDGPLSYQWRRNGSVVTGATDAAYMVVPTAAAADNGARFDVVVSNAFGVATSAVAQLTVNSAVPEPPTILSQPDHVLVMEPNPASFAVLVTGTAPFSYQWRRNGAAVPGAEDAVYDFGATTLADNGTSFDVVVSNAYGSVTSVVAVLSVSPFVPEPPTIAAEPEDATAIEPWAAVFTVDAGGTLPLRYQWRRNGSVLSGETNATYRLEPTSVAGDNGAVFDVIVTNDYGAATSRAALLTVNPYVPDPPAIIEEPSDVSVTEPAAATFAVYATGEGELFYQWRRDGAPVAAATNAAYVLSPTDAAADEGALYDVVVSSVYGSVTSRTATLTVNEFVTVPVSIVAQPQAVNVMEPDPASFTVGAVGDAPILYQWRRDGVDITGARDASYTLTPTDAAADDGAAFEVVVSNPYGVETSTVAVLTVAVRPQPPVVDNPPDDLTVMEPDAAVFSVSASGRPPLHYQWRRDGSPIAGATNTAYTLSPTSLGDNGAMFDVVVSNADGVATSAVATLTVTPFAVPPTVTEDPYDATVHAPDPAAFTVSATGTAPLSYQWRRDGVAIPGARTAAYTLSPTAVPDNGAIFDVVVSNAAGVATSAVATLTVLAPLAPPSITEQPQDQTVTAPAPAAFSVTAEGSAPLSYQWRWNGTPIAGANSAAYVLPSTDVADSGAQFDVIVSNPAGSVTSQVAELTVEPAVEPPVVTMQPQSRTVKAPNAAIFSVRASGDPPLAYQWRRNGVPIAGATAWDYTFGPTAESDSGTEFDAVVSNAGGSVTSQVAVLTVTAAVEAPVVTMQPSDRTVEMPSGVAFSVRASGDPPLSYQWRRNGVPIAGATAWDYILNATGIADDGAVFDAVISNGGGSVTSRTATLTVTYPPQPPSITRQPDDVAATMPNPATFRVEAAGETPLFYQWRRNGAVIPGATGADYTVDPTVLGDDGAAFDVVVSNSIGAVVSAAAVLSVTDVAHAWRRPTLTWDPVPGAEWYHVWIQRNGSLYYKTWLNQTNASWSPSFDLPGGDYTWWVRGWGPADGLSAWAGAYTFAIQTVIPGVVELYTPEGTLADAVPAFTWSYDPTALWYLISVSRGGAPYKSAWVRWWTLQYTFPDRLPVGTYEAHIRGWSPDGFGPWSPATAFEYGMSAPLAPTGTVTGTRTPVFTWTAAAGAEWYQLWLSRNGRAAAAPWVEGATEWIPPADLASGDYRWWVRTWNSDGMGLWSDPVSFSVPAILPGAPAPLAPTGTVVGVDVEYRWAAEPDATWYRLKVGSDGGNVHDAWYETGSVTGEVAVTVSNHVPGSVYTWWVVGWNDIDGAGPWSTGTTFQVQ